jgi:DNA-binding NarL/FixJ family response regulator
MSTDRSQTSRTSDAQLTEAEIAVALVAGEGPRESIGAILQEQGWRLAAFDSVAELIAHDERHESGLVALWVAEANADAARQVQELTRSVEHALVVVICPAIERWEVRAVLGAGASGVVLEEEMGGALGPCLQAVRVGQVCVPSSHGRQVAPPALSMREKQILGLVVMGYMNSQIAEQLFLAESTVKSHLSSAFGKLGVRSRNEAVNLIMDSERGFGMGILALGSEPIDAEAGKAASS